MIKLRPGIQYTEGRNQATFKCQSNIVIAIWRRAFIIRYVKTIGAGENYLIKWNDLDKKTKPLTINDERKLFDWKSPLPQEIDKTVIAISIKRKKNNLYYNNVLKYKYYLIQGQKPENGYIWNMVHCYW